MGDSVGMNLVASLVVHNELDRYLEPCVEHLLEFCDHVVIVDDCSTDRTWEWLSGYPDNRLSAGLNTKREFFEHEGHTRQKLLDYTLMHNPTHILAIDADEFISDGGFLREQLENQPDEPRWDIMMEEVWNITEDGIQTREDGGWVRHWVPICWKVPDPYPHDWQIQPTALACGRVPPQVYSYLANLSFTSILHLGWVNKSERQRRYDRYVLHDGGNFHASAHLNSIMLPDHAIHLRDREWPDGLSAQKTAVFTSATAERG